jgi:hypothetical protein
VTLLNGSDSPVSSLTVPTVGTYSLDTTTGAITFTAVLGYAGTPAPVTYKITDAYGSTQTATYTPAVTLPVIPGPPATTTTTLPATTTTTTLPVTPVAVFKVVAGSQVMTYVHAGIIPVAVSCRLTSCIGSANVTVARIVTNRGIEGWKHLILAKATFSLHLGETKVLSLKVTAVGRSVLAEHLEFWTKRQGHYRMTFTSSDSSVSLTTITSGPGTTHKPVNIRAK